MAIKYSRLNAGLENTVCAKYVKLVKSKIPTAFLRQQVFLVSIGEQPTIYSSLTLESTGLLTNLA